MMQITEDTPPDMLAGAMDLTVHLPNAGQSPIKISVNRSTPMMDLLVQVTTAHRLQPSAHIIQAIGYATHQSGADAIILPYKPNTPIGALDTKLIKIIPKSPSKYAINNNNINNNNNNLNINNKLNTSNIVSNVLTSAGIGNRGTLTRTTDQLPFESTFRLQVHLPRNQLYVARVSQFVTLENIMKKVCTEKNLDEKKYEFRHPVNFHEVLDPKLTLSDYQITEVTVVKKGKAVSASDMATLQREEERRRQQARNGGGVFNLIFKRGKSGMGSGSVSSDTRSISPTRSDSSQSRSITPPAIQHTTPKIIENKHENEKEFSKPKPPLRKRRPAPKPPTTTTTTTVVNNNNNNTENIEKSVTTQITTVNECSEKIIDENNTTPLTICHSRNSSDSSGYHEASILSDTFNVQTLPRKNKALTSSTNSINYGGGTLPTHFEEKNKNNMTAMGNHSKSTSNLSLTGQKKKRAPPPPPIKSSVSVTNLSTPTSSVVVSAKAVESSPATTQPAIINITESILSQQLSPAPCLSPTSVPSSVTSTLDKKPKEIQMFSNESPAKSERKEPTAVIAIHPVELPPQFTEPLSINTSSEETNSVEIKSDEFNSEDAEWQYQLPSPPTAFRDTSPTNFTEVTNYDTITLNGLPSSKLLDEKSTTASSSSQEQRSETTTIVTENEKILPEYTEITTPPQEFSDIKHFSLETLEQRKSQVLDKQLASLKLESPVNNPKEKLRNELEEVIQNVPKVPKQPKVKQEITTQTDFSALPNFTLTTYDQPKRVINIFEDDSVRSNVDTKMPEKKSPVAEVVDSAPIIKRSSGISERDMNIMNTLQNNNDFKKPIVVDIKKKTVEKSSKSIENLYEKSNGIQRADSFHISESNNIGINESLNPVKRSKSHVSLNKYKLFNGGSNTIDLNGVTSSSPPRKTSSQWDISDLQSLQVMRTILPKIQNSQPNSPEEEKPVEIIKEVPKKVNVPEVSRKPYHYSPPSVNLGTWSERPKSQVSLKSDNDYKIGGINISKFEKRPSENDRANSESKTSTTRFINHTTAVGFKRPEPVSKTLPRPHSIAFDTYQDLSRVPIVRAVELKKTFRDNLENKSNDMRSQTLGRPSFHRSTESVNQELKLCPTDNDVSKNGGNFENHVELRSTQTLGRNVKNIYRNSEPNSLENKEDVNRNEISNNVLRNINKFSVNDSSNTFNFNRSSNSFLLNRNSNLTPVVKGFRSLTPTVTTNGAELNSKPKPQTQPEKYTTKCIPVNMPRSESESKFTVTVNGQNFKNSIPPPPMPKVTAVTKKVTKITPQEDPRDQLLNAIRNFGKDSLKPVRY